MFCVNTLRAGDEIVQLYLRDDYSTVTTWEKELRGFARVSLAPGETKTVKFTLTPEHLALYDRAGRWTVEPGGFTVFIGASSDDVRLQGRFVVTRPDGTAPETRQRTTSLLRALFLGHPRRTARRRPASTTPTS